MERLGEVHVVNYGANMQLIRQNFPGAPFPESWPDHPELAKAVQLIAAGQKDEAYAVCHRLVHDKKVEPFSRYLMALCALECGEFMEAQAQIERALLLNPQNFAFLDLLAVIHDRAGRVEMALDVLLELGNAFMRCHDLDRAMAVYRLIIAKDSQRMAAYANLGLVMGLSGAYVEAAKSIFVAVLLVSRVHPSLPPLVRDLERHIHFLAEAGAGILETSPTGVVNHVDEVLTSLGRVLSNLRMTEWATACHRMAIEIRPASALAHWNLALELLLSGHYSEGWSEYEWRWLREPTMNQRRRLPVPRWLGHRPLPKRIMVFAEQGFGDTLQFAPLVSQLAEQGVRVVFQVYTQLVRLLAHNMNNEHVTVMSLPGHPDLMGTDEPVDSFVALMSLAHFMRLDSKTLPLQKNVLVPVDEDVVRWAQWLGPASRWRIGIAWSGNVNQTDNLARSLPKADLMRLLQVNGVEWISLQVGERNADFADCAGRNPVSQLQDFADTAALIQLVDMVITVDTAVAHLAAAMGKTVWVLLAFASDWRWGIEGEASNWYPSARLFRQKTIGGWDGVVGQVISELNLLSMQ